MRMELEHEKLYLTVRIGLLSQILYNAHDN